MNITKEDLQNLIESGKSVKEIASFYNCGEMTIYRRIHSFNLKKTEPMYKNKEFLINELATKDIATIASENNVDSHTISRWVKRFSISKPTPLYQNKNWLLEQTYKFNTVKELCEHYGFVEYTVKSWCRTHNIVFNGGSIKSFNEQYFENIDTENKAYFLGFLMADGFMHKSLKNFGIGLKEGDSYMIEKLLKEINYKSDIEIRESGFGTPAAYVTICSTKMCSSLVYLGIVPKKSGKEIFPEYAIPDELKKHFIRGFIDGDGWISNKIVNGKYNSLEVGMCSMSLNILVSIQTFLKENLDITASLTKRSNKDNLYDLKIFTKNAKKLLDYLYSDATIYLHRKKIKYDNVQLGPVNKNV